MENKTESNTVLTNDKIKTILREAIPQLAEKMARASDGQSALSFAEAIIRIIERLNRFGA